MVTDSHAWGLRTWFVFGRPMMHLAMSLLHYAEVSDNSFRLPPWLAGSIALVGIAVVLVSIPVNRARSRKKKPPL